MSTIFFILKYAPLAVPKALYLSMESILVPILRNIKTSFSACTLTDMTAVHCSLQSCTSVLAPPKSSLASQLLRSNTQTAFTIGTFPNFNHLDDEDFNYLLRENSLCLSHIVHNFMSQSFNIHAQGIANYK